MPLVGGEGRISIVGIILAPSRELVRQTYEIVQNLAGALAKANFPQLRCQLVILIGGENSRDQLQPFRDQGVHALRCGESWAAKRFYQEKKYYLGHLSVYLSR